VIRRRLLVLLLQLVVAVPGAIGAGLSAPAVAPVRAAGECQVDPGPDGGLLSTCPEVDTFDAFSAQIGGALDNARASKVTGRLIATSTPSGAAVTVNGLPAGITPLDIPMPVGSQLVRMTLPGYAPFSTTARVAKGGTTVDAALVPMGGDLGSFEWLRASALIGQVGGYANGAFEVTHFLKDRDGTWWIAFINAEDQWFESEEPDGAPFYTGIQTKARHSLSINGVARSSDNGASWVVAQSWRDTFSVRGWTSEEFHDSKWDPGDHTEFPDDFDHVVRVYYTERSSEEYVVTDLLPRAEGGVSIVLSTWKSHIPQDVEGVWDNAGSQNYPGEFMGDTVTKLADDPVYESVTSDEAQGRYGMSREDLATYWWQDSETGQKLVVPTGGETPITAAGLPTAHTELDYQGSHDGVDYFLSYSYTGSDIGPLGYVLASRDGGRTMTVDATYTIPADNRGRFPYEDLRIGPDGTKYLVEHLAAAGSDAHSAIFVIEGGGTRQLGTTPAGMVVGVAGGNNLPFLAAAFDSAGNLHAAFRSSITADDNRQINVYYQLFPKAPVQYDGVALLTQPDCPGCDAAAKFLGDAGVPFQQDPSDLPPEVAASAAAQASSVGYPVLVRLGDEAVAVGAADIPTISRLLGLSQPVLVETYEPRRSQRAIEPQWLAMIVEGDQPRIVVDHQTGVVVLSPSAAGWTQAPLLSSPPQIQDPAGVTLSRRYPWLGSSSGTGGFLEAQHDVPFNTIERAADFAYLHQSAATYVTDGVGEQHSQFDYTLWTTQGGGESSEFRAVTEVSQLIPAGVFWVALGEHGKAAKVTGELAGYVTREQEVTDGGGRFYRVTVDLRARNETATDGNIQGRTIGGTLEVETTTEDGEPETRQVSLVLLVQNTRLRAFDPGSRAFARDITTEAVHFTGLDERWQVVNNIGLKNSLPCGPDQWLVLKPFDVATFTKDDVDAWDIGSCLAAAEVTPTVLEGCGSWEEAQQVLAAETLAALTMSLPITRSEGETNWELAYGSREATIRRVVSLDRTVGSGPDCADATTGSNAALVEIRGHFIGKGEPYQPAITITASGPVEVQTAALARPGDLAWEREWLEFEGAFLEANLSLTIGSEAVGTWLFLGGLSKRVEYLRQLLAVRALVHCNHFGVDVASVANLLRSTAGVPGALRDAAKCLQDFVLNPTTYWATYDPHIWAGGSQQADFTGDVMGKALVSNVTLAFLVAAGKGLALDYGLFVIEAARLLRASGTSDVAVDYELDDYARLATAAASDLNGIDGGLLKAFLLSGEVERATMRTVIECIRSMGSATTLAGMIEVTSKREFAGGIPCVDGQSGQAAKLQRFQELAIGLRSGTFGALLDAAGRDLNLLGAYLDRYLLAADAGTKLEHKFPGAAIDSWRWDSPAAERLMLAVRQMQAIAEERGRKVTVAEIARNGLTQCGIGLVEGLVSSDSLLMIGLGTAAAMAGPGAAVVGGLIFVGYGVVTTAVGAFDLAQAWETLDTTARTAEVCGVAAGAVMTAVGARHIGTQLMSLQPEALRANPPKTIDAETIPSRGRSAGLTLEEQGKVASARGSSITAVPEPPSVAIDAALEQVVGGLPETHRRAALEAADRLGYRQMSDVEQAVVRELLGDSASTQQPPATVRFLRQVQLQTQGLLDSAEWRAWDVVGEAVLEVLAGNEPKSLSRRVEPARAATADAPAEPARVVGFDAELLKAGRDANATPEKVGLVGLTDRTGRQLNDLKVKQPILLQALLRSKRVVDALNSRVVRPLLTAVEADALYELVNQARPDIDSSFFLELASTRFVESLRTAVANAQDRVRTQPIKGITVEAFDPGLSKVAFRLTLTLEDGSKVDLVVAKGNIAVEEAAAFATYGPKHVTPRLLAPFMENVDGTQGLMFSEFWPGRKARDGVLGFDDLYDATAEADYARAIGGLMARIWSETRNANGEAIFDSDLHGKNFNVRGAGGLDGARVIDFGGQFARRAGQRAFWTAELLRRVQQDAKGWGIKNMDAFLDGVFEQMSKDPKIGRSNALALLRDLSLDLLDPDALAEARAIQTFIDDPTIVTKASTILDGWLARHKQGGVVVPFPSLQWASAGSAVLLAA
jgi:hypothetical protein